MKLSTTALQLFALLPLTHAFPHSEATVTHQISKRASASTYAGYAKQAIQQLQTWYDDSNGLWDKEWWNSANVITMLADFQEYFPNDVKDVTSHVFSNTLAKAPNAFGFKGFINDYYDDELWWALAWIKVYDVTNEQKYLDQASSIFEDSKKIWGSATCGGLWWDKKHTYVNTIANTLYFTTAAKLANRKPSTPSSGYYFNEAMRSYNFLINSGLKNSDNLFNDGLDMKTCKNNNGPVFTYNQGVILSGLTELTWATNDKKYNELANTIALSTISHLVDSNGILKDPCEPNGCNGDIQQFKGVFMRNLEFMVRRANVLPADTKSKFVSFLKKNADSIWAKDMSGGKLGLVWSGPYQTATVQTQSSALDALVGAAAVA